MSTTQAQDARRAERRAAALAAVPAAQRAAGREAVRRQLAREDQHRLDRARLRLTQRQEHARTPEPEMLAWCIRRMTALLDRVRRGTESARTVQARLTALAPALPVAIYDAAVDALETAALTSGQELRPVDWEAARVRVHPDGRDAHTREAVRRQRRIHRRTYGKGAGGVGTRIEANDASRVGGSKRWRGELLADMPDAGPVVELRPVWAVSPDGTTQDAAVEFEVPWHGPHHIGPAVEYASGQRGKRGRLVTPDGWGWEQQSLDVSEPVVQDRRQHPVSRAIGPDSPWRVPSVPAVSPLTAQAEQVRAEHRAQAAVQAERAAAYARDGWAHGRAAVSDEELTARVEWQQQHPALAGFLRMMQRAEHAAWLRSLGAGADGSGVRYGAATRPASPPRPEPPSPARNGVVTA